MCSLFGCTPQAEGRLKYPDIDKDKTEVLKKQVDGLVENVKDVFTFSFTFIRTVKEDLSMRIQEAHEGRLARARSLGILEVEEPYPRQYKATFKLTVKKALEVLKVYGVDLDFQVHRTYLAKTETGKEIVDFPKRPTTDPPKTPRAGIESNMRPADCPTINDRPPVPHIPTQTARVVVSHEFNILVGYGYANREDFFEVRLGIWHEIMELAILALTMEALYWPLDLYHFRYINDIPNSFANAAVAYVQQCLCGSEGRKKFLYWKGDPPFEAFESQSRSHEKEAERLASNASSLDKGGSHLQANSKWKECAEAWERAAKAWDASTHPDARSKAKDAREEMRVAAKKAGHWEVNPSSGKEITIKYRDWFGDFEAEILDTTGRRIDKFTRSIEQGEICWGAEGRIKAGTYFVKVKLLGDEFETEKIAILG